MRDFPLTDIHPSAMLAAVAARCAADQGAFWPMSERLFATHRVEWGGVPRRDRAVIVEFAAEFGLDGPTFEACLDDPAVEQAVRLEQQAAQQLGINSTPNFLVNGRLLRGALSLNVFEDLLNQIAP